MKFSNLKFRCLFSLESLDTYLTEFGQCDQTVTNFAGLGGRQLSPLIINAIRLVPLIRLSGDLHLG
jgi:hypothetical protein